MQQVLRCCGPNADIPILLKGDTIDIRREIFDVQLVIAPVIMQAHGTIEMFKKLDLCIFVCRS